jgi:hypothetical protein
MTMNKVIYPILFALVLILPGRALASISTNIIIRTRNNRLHLICN